MDERFKKRYEIYEDCGDIYKLLTHIPEVSMYNHNYYIGPPREGCCTKDLIYVEANDDNLEEFFVIRGDVDPEYIGYMYTEERNFILDDIRMT